MTGVDDVVAAERTDRVSAVEAVDDVGALGSQDYVMAVGRLSVRVELKVDRHLKAVTEHGVRIRFRIGIWFRVGLSGNRWLEIWCSCNR